MEWHNWELKTKQQEWPSQQCSKSSRKKNSTDADDTATTLSAMTAHTAVQDQQQQRIDDLEALLQSTRMGGGNCNNTGSGYNNNTGSSNSSTSGGNWSGSQGGSRGSSNGSRGGRGSSNSNSNRTYNPRSDGPANMTKTGQYYGNDNYCWSHGYNVAKNHDSKSCKEEWRHTGHKEEANGDNPMKGSTKDRQFSKWRDWWCWERQANNIEKKENKSVASILKSSNKYIFYINLLGTLRHIAFNNKTIVATYQQGFLEAMTKISPTLTALRMNSDIKVGQASCKKNDDCICLNANGGNDGLANNDNNKGLACIRCTYEGGGVNYVQYDWEDTYFAPAEKQASYYYSDGDLGNTFPTIPYQDVTKLYYDEIQWDMMNFSYSNENLTNFVQKDTYKSFLFNTCLQVLNNPEVAMQNHINGTLGQTCTQECEANSDSSVCPGFYCTW
jgi:hypothetical protein